MKFWLRGEQRVLSCLEIALKYILLEEKFFRDIGWVHYCFFDLRWWRDGRLRTLGILIRFLRDRRDVERPPEICSVFKAKAFEVIYELIGFPDTTDEADLFLFDSVEKKLFSVWRFHEILK